MIINGTIKTNTRYSEILNLQGYDSGLLQLEQNAAILWEYQNRKGIWRTLPYLTEGVVFLVPDVLFLLISTRFSLSAVTPRDILYRLELIP